MHEDSVRRIKRDQRFAREWDRRCAELNIHPERTQSVIDSLHAQAVGGSVQAASLYLQYVEKFTPKRRLVVDDEREASGLSDVELADELEAQVLHLRVVENNGS
jgi:ribosome-binding protein aMBF1 (putative translation factor)